MALILGFDTETTGLDVNNDYILGVSHVVYDTDAKMILHNFSRFIKWPTRPVSCPEAFETHRITQSMIDSWGIPFSEYLSDFFKSYEKCQCVVGHNVLAFDKLILEKNIMKTPIEREYFKEKFNDLKWLDTMVDIEFPKNIKHKTLDYLAFKHGYFNNNSHSALFDICASIHLVDMYGFERIWQESRAEKIEVLADVEYSEKHLAKNEGFSWDPGLGIWKKKIKKDDFEKLKEQYPFIIKEIKNVSLTSKTH